MEAPVCRVCGSKHWSGEAHVFEKRVEEAVSSGQALPEVPSQVRSTEQKATGQVARNRRWREKNRERYNKYMREYRKR